MATIKSQMALNDGMSIVLKHIIKNMQTLNGSFIAMQQSCDEAVHIKNFEAASASLSEQIALAERLTNGYGEATEMEERLNQNIQTGTAAANGMLSSVKKLVSAFGIATGVKKAIDLSDQMSSTRARLSLIADDSQAASVADGIMEKFFSAEIEKSASYLTFPAYKCNCSRKKIEGVILPLGLEELLKICEEEGKVSVHCHYCNTDYAFTKAEVLRLFGK